MDEKKFVPGEVETEKVSAGQWLRKYRETQAMNEEALEVVDFIQMGVNLEAKLSIPQRKLILEAIGLAVVQKKNRFDVVKDAVSIATFINSCR